MDKGRIGRHPENGPRPRLAGAAFPAHVSLTMPPENFRSAPLFERLGGRAKLAILVRNFYASLQIHPTLGSIFAANVENWPAHYARLTEFWSLQTGGPSQYRGRLLHTHAALNLRPEYFDLWLMQWRQSCRLHFEEPEAGEIIALAESLAGRMRGSS